MQVLLAGPRGFCAGVSRAVEIVERVLEIYGAPVYVKHEIIHNHQVVADLRNRGAVFVESLDEVPPGSPLIFSAHGVPPSDRTFAEARGLKVIDATCPLVTKVHLEAIRYARRGYHVLYIGHRGHPEPIGTLGEIGPEQGTLIETLAEADTVSVPDPERVVVLTQTTLSVQDTQAILERLRERLPKLELPPTEDICYATTNRQAAVAELSDEAELVLVVGSKTSSNSNRLVETARAKGRAAYLVQSPEEIVPAWLDGVKTVALSSGASAPEYLVQATIARLRELGAQHVEERVIVAEDVSFPLPRVLLQVIQSGNEPPGRHGRRPVSDRDQILAASEATATEEPQATADAESTQTPTFPKIRKRRKGPYASDDCGAPPPADFLKGIHEFNAGEFFEQHETLELLWRATESDIRYLYQGVLLIGVGFYHQQQNNFHGTQAKLVAGIEMLEWFAPACQTVDVADLIARARVCLEQVRTLGRDRLQEFDRSLIPQVKLLG